MDISNPKNKATKSWKFALLYLVSEIWEDINDITYQMVYNKYKDKLKQLFDMDKEEIHSLITLINNTKYSAVLTPKFIPSNQYKDIPEQEDLFDFKLQESKLKEKIIL